jgi:hypothetical protein
MEMKDFYIEFFKKTLVMNGKGSGLDFTLSEIKVLAALRDDKEYSMGELSKNAQVALTGSFSFFISPLFFVDINI